MHLLSLQSMPVLFATNFHKIFGSYLGHQVPPKQFCVSREGKGREGARGNKMQKGVQSTQSCERSSEKNWIPAGWDGFQHVSVRFPERRSQWPNEHIMKKASAHGPSHDPILHDIFMRLVHKNYDKYYLYNLFNNLIFINIF